jgi:ribosomal protein L37AE/L43A
MTTTLVEEPKVALVCPECSTTLVDDKCTNVGSCTRAGAAASTGNKQEAAAYTRTESARMAARVD